MRAPRSPAALTAQNSKRQEDSKLERAITLLDGRESVVPENFAIFKSLRREKRDFPLSSRSPELFFYLQTEKLPLEMKDKKERFFPPRRLN